VPRPPGAFVARLYEPEPEKGQRGAIVIDIKSGVGNVAGAVRGYESRGCDAVPGAVHALIPERIGPTEGGG
jgi:hypothetical protein